MRIQRPDGSVITFKYDAFGRRISKKYLRREFLYIWDKNVPLHEIQKEELCEDNIITWIFDGFTPTAKLINGKAYSIISDHIGTPILAVDTQGNKVWERELDIYGKVRKEFTHDSVKDRRSGFMPFLYAGQYYDKETELAYNRFRYYDPNSGNYISQDPIGLEGGLALYSYVHDSNTWIDKLGLVRGKHKLKPNKEAGGNHSTFQFDNNGNIFKYETYEMVENDKGEKFFNPIKRFDGGEPDGSEGKPHKDSTGTPIPTPHINLKGGSVRIPEDDEFPNNKRFKDKNNCNG